LRQTFYLVKSSNTSSFDGGSRAELGEQTTAIGQGTNNVISLDFTIPGQNIKDAAKTLGIDKNSTYWIGVVTDTPSNTSFSPEDEKIQIDASKL
jgi:hypothetical protein